MEVQEIKGQDQPKTERDKLRESFKGKPSLSPQEINTLLLQMAKDLGYLK